MGARNISVLSSANRNKENKRPNQPKTSYFYVKCIFGKLNASLMHI